MKKLLLGIVGVAGFAASVNAAATWDTQIRFSNRVGSTENVIAGNSLPLTATGTYTFTVQVGIFNLQGAGAGQSNFGLYDFTANAASSGLGVGETLGVVSTNARVSPFNFGPATSFGGTLAGGGTAINNIDAARDVSGGATAPWNWDSDAGAPGPLPTGPTNPSPGANTFANVWRFQVVVNSLVGSDIVVTFAGSAGPILSWQQFGTNPPDEENAGNASFIGITRNASDGGPLSAYSPATLVLKRVPAPGSIALLGLGGLLAARRRRA